jgi:transcriptional regulator with XRE-family HTH domain
MKNTRINGNQWKTLRERAGLTQREVSDTLGYSTPQFISNVERGRCRFPVQKLPKIKKLYRLSTDQILDLFLTEERSSLLKVFKKAGARN